MAKKVYHGPIIRRVELDPDNKEHSGYYPFYRQFLYIDKVPIYKFESSNYDALMDKVAEMMNEDTRLDMYTTYNKSYWEKYVEEVRMTKLPGYDKYYEKEE